MIIMKIGASDPTVSVKSRWDQVMIVDSAAEFTLHPPGPPLRAHARATRNGAGTLNPPRPLHHNAAAARMLLLPGSCYCCCPVAARLVA